MLNQDWGVVHKVKEQMASNPVIPTTAGPSSSSRKKISFSEPSVTSCGPSAADPMRSAIPVRQLGQCP